METSTIPDIVVMTENPMLEKNRPSVNLKTVLA
jgi:hypothetical protein